MNLSAQDAELTTIQSAKVRALKVSKTSATPYVSAATELATTNLLQASSKALDPATPLSLQAPDLSAKGGRLQELIHENVRYQLKAEGFAVTDASEMPAGQGRITIKHVVVGEEARITLTLVDPQSNVTLSKQTFSLILNSALRAYATE